MSKRKSGIDITGTDSVIDMPVEKALKPVKPPKPTRLSELDFTELKKLDTEYQQVFQQLNFTSGNIIRLQKDAENLLRIEQERFASLEKRRQEIVKRYGIDETRKWQITPDAEVVYE